MVEGHHQACGVYSFEKENTSIPHIVVQKEIRPAEANTLRCAFTATIYFNLKLQGPLLAV